MPRWAAAGGAGSGAGRGGAGVWSAGGGGGVLQTKGEGLMVSWISLLVVSAGPKGCSGNANQPSPSGMQPGLPPGTRTRTHTDTRTRATAGSLTHASHPSRGIDRDPTLWTVLYLFGRAMV